MGELLGKQIGWSPALSALYGTNRLIQPPTVTYGGPDKSDLEKAADFLNDTGLAVRSAFSENSIASAISATWMTQASEYDPDFDPFSYISGTPYKAFSLSFINANNPDDVTRIKNEIDKRQEWVTAGENSSAFQHIIGMVLAQGLDPLNYLGGALLKVGGLGLKAATGLQFGARAITASAISAAAQEAALSATQVGRTPAESLTNLGSQAAFLTSLHMLNRLRKGTRSSLSQSFDEHMRNGLTTTTQNVRAAFDLELTGRMRSTSERRSAAGIDNPAARSVFDSGLPNEKRNAPGITNPATPLGRAPAIPVSPSGRTGTVPTKVGKITDRMHPASRVLNSSNTEAASVMEKLAEHAQILKKNWLGIKTEHAVETLKKAWMAPLAMTITKIIDHHVAYRVRESGLSNTPMMATARYAIKDVIDDKLGKGRRHMSLTEFRQAVTKELFTPGVSKIPEVVNAAKDARKLFDAIAKDSVDVGLLKADEIDPNYVHRYWNVEMVRKYKAGLVNLIVNWQRNNLPAADRDSLATVVRKVEAVANSNEQLGDLTEDMLSGPKGIFKSRTINVPNEMLGQFIETDIDVILRRYIHQATADIELQRKFGSVTLEKQIKAIEDNARSRIAAATSVAKKEEIAKELANDIRDVKAVRDILRSVYALPDNPYGLSSIAARVAMDFNNMVMLGGVTLSSLPDAARIIAVNTLEHTMPGLKLMINDFQTWKVGANEAKLAGVALDMVLQTRAMALAMAGDMPSRYSRFERFVGSFTDMAFMANLLSPWNSFIKQAAGVTTSHRIIAESIKWANGTISKNQRVRLLSAGIDSDMARKIADLFQQHGETVRGVHLPNTQRWVDVDPDTATAFRATLAKEIDSTIVTPGAGDLPLFMRGGEIPKWMPEWFPRLVMQYKSFVIGSAARVMVPGLQMRDAQVLHGIMMMTFVGGVVTMLKDAQANRPGVSSPLEFIVDGFDQSGAGSVFMAANNGIETLTNNTLGIRPLLGIGRPYSPSTRYKIGTVGGPTAGQLVRLGEVGSDIVTGEFDIHTVKNLYNMIPMRDLFYLNMAEHLEAAHTYTKFQP